MKEDIHNYLDYGEYDADEAGVAERNETDYAAGEHDSKCTLFWRFPRGKGKVQPWRRRLWELQNKSDRE
ncbi:hypothetical protein [Paenibacillus sp. MMS20-IR301]|uniref:hypothetical protein n=1 Tax=Paenibacillus sp. MMS20-IR301 TaxID=2895946 RepID=UPI0028ED5B10|nr:hypothetical protein [Paenibacillus sp. MMS20-IR301]WNS43001.1 hypothetical protein LOS79_29210 [Paenibacillus sp. MMS20-IR301]